MMHCAKVTGSLLTEERIFKEYLVHFRRPQPPAATVPSATTQSGTPVSAARAASANGSASKPSVAPEGVVPAEGGSGATVAGARGGVSASGGGGASEAPPADDVRGKDGSDHPGAEGGRPRASAEKSALLNGSGTAAATAAGAAFTSPGKKTAKTTPRSGRKSYTAGGADGGGGDGGAGAAAARVTEQNGPRGEGALQDVLVWNESGMARSMGCRYAWARMGVASGDRLWQRAGLVFVAFVFPAFCRRKHTAATAALECFLDWLVIFRSETLHTRLFFFFAGVGGDIKITGSAGLT